MSKQKILPVEPLIQCEAGRAKTMQRQSLYSPRTPKWPPSDKGELWRDNLLETFHSVAYPATAKIVAKQVARKVELNSTFGNGSCNLSRNDFGRCRVCYTVKCFVQLVPPQCRQNIAGQVARNISQCDNALRIAAGDLFETRTATGIELFSSLTYLDTDDHFFIAKYLFANSDDQF